LATLGKQSQSVIRVLMIDRKCMIGGKEDEAA
jgi:hypothetical protein